MTGCARFGRWTAYRRTACSVVGDQQRTSDPWSAYVGSPASRLIAFIKTPEVIDLPVPGTADREGPDAPDSLARLSPQPAIPVVLLSAMGRAAESVDLDTGAG